MLNSSTHSKEKSVKFLFLCHGSKILMDLKSSISSVNRLFHLLMTFLSIFSLSNTEFIKWLYWLIITQPPILCNLVLLLPVYYATRVISVCCKF